MKEAAHPSEMADAPREDLSLEEERIVLQKQLGQRKRQLLEIEQRCAEYYDARSVPLDLEETRRQIKAEIARVEALLAQLPMQ